MRAFQRICLKFTSYLSLSGLPRPLPQVTCSAKVPGVFPSAGFCVRIWGYNTNMEKTLFLSSRGRV